MKDSFENILVGSKRKPSFLETDRGKEFYNKLLQSFLNIINITHYSGNTCLGVVFAERFNRTFRDLSERFVFLKGASNWIDVLPPLTKQ